MLGVMTGFGCCNEHCLQPSQELNAAQVRENLPWSCQELTYATRVTSLRLAARLTQALESARPRRYNNALLQPEPV